MSPQGSRTAFGVYLTGAVLGTNIARFFSRKVIICALFGGDPMTNETKRFILFMLYRFFLPLNQHHSGRRQGSSGRLPRSTSLLLPLKALLLITSKDGFFNKTIT